MHSFLFLKAASGIYAFSKAICNVNTTRSQIRGEDNKTTCIKDKEFINSIKIFHIK